MDADERDEVFYGSFEKVYRRAPPSNLEHGVDRFWGLCRMAQDVGEGALVHAGAAEDPDMRAFVKSVLEEFANTKRVLRALEYSDLEHYALILIRHPEVVAALRGRYAHIFVDEFQDTSAMQCELVNALTGTDGMVFVVGDVKQSIYRFRGADVQVFREFIKTLPARRLSKNFRSHAEVIETVNNVCTPVIDGYEPMLAGRLEDDFTLPPKIFDAIPRIARVTADTDAEGIETILRRLRARGVDFSQVVLLLRRIKGNAQLFADLAARGIGVAITSSASASANEDLKTLVNLWIWACEPWSRLRAAQVVTDFATATRDQLGEGIAALQSPLQPGARLTCEELLERLNTQFNLSERFGAVFEQFEVFVLRHQSEGLAPSVLARRLHHLTANGQDITGFVLLPPPANLAGTIRALTVHSAKGLEFPVVILADVKAQRKRASGLLRRGSDIWLPQRNEKNELDWSAPELQNAKAFEEEAETEESARLLYVAMTRAQEALYIVDRPSEQISDEATAKKKAPKKPDNSWAAWLKAGITQHFPQELFLAEAPALIFPPKAFGLRPSPSLSEVPPHYTKARTGVTEWAAELAAAQPVVARKPAAPSPAGKVRVSKLSRQDAIRLGTEFHKFLENEDWDSLKREAEAHSVSLAKFWDWLPTTVGETVFGASPRVYPEFAFEWRNGQSTITGRIDRLVITSSNESWVIDYKVLLQPKSLDELLASYGPQLRIYNEAVKHLTKVPIVRSFILDLAAATGEIWHEVPSA